MQNNNELKIEYQLFNIINKPKDYLMTKIINVYDNRYRINIYCEKEEDGLNKKRICDSYFAIFNKDVLTITNSGIQA